jgi:carboxylesterase type B
MRFSLYFCTAFLFGHANARSTGPTAKTRNGTHAGVHMPQFSQDAFLGVPFAHAPRLDLAQSLNESWHGTRNATAIAPSCAGFGSNNPQLEQVEDCLNLNIVRPAGIKHNAKLPVLVWIYGGGFHEGSINDPKFNTSYIIQTSVRINKPVIVVAISYRLSAMGWLFSIEVQNKGVTNLGLRDQWKALKWIQENIAGFGGDPDNVTIWGQSAGAFSVGWLTLAYGGNNSGLFKRAIMVSGSSFGNSNGNLIEAQTAYNNIANSTGCYYAIDSLQCLRDCKSTSLPYPSQSSNFLAFSAF